MTCVTKSSANWEEKEMNLIVNKRLDQQEELAIYELTLKKQRSKKPKASDKHAAAIQRLAEELLCQRKVFGKLNQVKLKQLNEELENRLNQYEYLVAQEKALLSANNLNLFTNEGVNNFRHFELHRQKMLQTSQSCSSIPVSNQWKRF